MDKHIPIDWLMCENEKESTFFKSYFVSGLQDEGIRRSVDWLNMIQYLPMVVLTE